MSGHRDDGTFAENKAHHPGRGVSRDTPRIRQALSENLGISDNQANDLIDAHRMGSEEEVYKGSTWEHDSDMADLQNKVTQKGGIKESISGALDDHKMNMKHGYGWQSNPESSWGLRG